VLILSAGMPRAGSGWHYNLIHDLIVAAGHQDARAIRKRYHLEGVLTEVNCNIGALTPRRLLVVMAPSMMGNTFAIKTHSAPTPLALTFIRRGWMRAIYIHRDPRDAMLSAMEHGKRARESGHENAFAHLKTFDDALAFTQQYLDIWEAWQSCREALHCRYEDLLVDYEAQLQPLLNLLQIDGSAPTIQEVIDRYHPEQSRSADQRGLHFRKGKIGRYREAFTAEQQEILNVTFEPFLIEMGYPF
jgi:hypothetical protein